MEDLKVSCIIPVYNVAPYLVKCLDSVIGQTYENIEIILIDDGSTDNSYQICKQFADNDSRVRLIHQENGGLSCARNTGIAQATGDYVLFIDSDDWLDTTMIDSLVHIALENKCDIVASGMFRAYKDDSKCINKSYSVRMYSARDYVFMMTKPHGVFCYACGRLIKRELIPINAFPVGKVFEDVMTMPKIVYKANKVVQTDAKYYYYRYRRTGISHGKFSYKSFHEMDGYISVVEFADSVNDLRIARNGILFFLTKYYYYKLRVVLNGMNMKWYKDTYAGIAHAYTKRLLHLKKND